VRFPNERDPDPPRSSRRCGGAGPPDGRPGRLRRADADAVCNEEAHRARLTEGLVPGKIDLNFVAERSGEIVGNAGLHPCGAATRRRHAMSIGMSVAREVQRQGVGTALMQALCDYADRWIAALRLELTVYANNEPAIALYRKFGFEMEGRHRAYALRDGVYVDALAMARLNPNPPAAQPA